MQNKKSILISLIILVALFVAGIYVYKKNQDNKLSEISSTEGVPFVREHSPKFGKNENKVTIVEFLDPECESCRSFYPVMRKLYMQYDNEIQIVVRYLANHKNSKYAVKILEASRVQNKYKDVENYIFYYQPMWGNHENPKPELIWDYLKDIEGLNIDKLKKDFDNINVDDILTLDKNDADSLGVTGTPAFFVNGQKLKDFSFEGLINLVESEIYK